jgi:hypothetical protein
MVIDLLARHSIQQKETPMCNFRAIWFPYNRCAKIIFPPMWTDSVRSYPNQFTGPEMLWQRAKPASGVIETND